ncbi:ThiF family adenylyltransferase [Albibacterium indicum]|uniref:ThiF family adenylyltransferase n=1 Tax=Albibacterium indicum TaxID=2292082 RepID=UPI000E550B5D|nr:ThiF family adenylyltransferase [Pedobacter indicus]
MNRIKISGSHYEQLKSHLFPGDGLEAVAIAICGRSIHGNNHTLLVQDIVPVPYDVCFERRGDIVHWPTDFINPLIEKAADQSLAIIKMHCHPVHFEQFSVLDDESDHTLFTSIHAWLDDDMPHASCIMLPDGRLFGRFFFNDMSTDVAHEITVAGSDIIKWNYDIGNSFIEHGAQTRNLQAFGKGTTALLNNLKIGVVGCSGTGSPTIEMLTRLGVGTLVLVDPDHIDTVNLNRITGSTKQDAVQKMAKVQVMQRTIDSIGIGTRTIVFQSNIVNVDVVKELADCDILFGCVDSIEGRHFLNLISSYYLVPLFDLGVRFDADGKGGIDSINGTVHYVQPHGSSLLSREVYDPERLRAESILRVDPEEYERNGYLAKAGESNPAVISVNTQIAATAINELLARIHPYRNDPNSESETVRIGISNGVSYMEETTDTCGYFCKQTGKGDTVPLLGSISL